MMRLTYDGMKTLTHAHARVHNYIYIYVYIYNPHSLTNFFKVNFLSNQNSQDDILSSRISYNQNRYY